MARDTFPPDVLESGRPGFTGNIEKREVVSMAHKILYPNDIGQRGQEFLKERGYEIKKGRGNDEASILADIVDCSGVMAGSDPYTKRVLEAAKQLKIIARFGVGYDTIDLPVATELGIQVTNTPVANSNAVAEHAIALLLACAKNIGIQDRQVRANNWVKSRQLLSVEVSGKTLGLIGLGNIGRLVAKKAGVGLDMKVIAYDPYLPADKFPAGVTRAKNMEEVFAASDFVSLHIPSTPETKKSINRKMFQLMKKGSFLINCARGDVVDEADLVQALKDGQLAAAGLDVLTKEPPDADNPLLKMEQTILIPHLASATPEAMDTMGMHAAQSIDEVLSGRKPSWPVNKPVQK